MPDQTPPVTLIRSADVVVAWDESVSYTHLDVYKRQPSGPRL